MLATSGGKTIVFDYADFFSNRTGRKICGNIFCELPKGLDAGAPVICGVLGASVIGAIAVDRDGAMDKDGF
jgi:hypothetical protein